MRITKIDAKNGLPTKGGLYWFCFEVRRIKRRKSEIMLKEAKNENLKERLKEMNEFLEEKEIRIERFDDVLVRKLIESIEINGDTILVEFKSGIKIEVK